MVRFKGFGDAGRRAQGLLMQAEKTAVAEKYAHAREQHGRSAQLLQAGETQEALRLLDGVLGEWERDATTARSLVSEIIAKTQTMRATALYRLGRFEDSLTACNQALVRYGAWEAKALEAQREIVVLLLLRLQSLKSLAVHGPSLIEVLEDSLEIVRGLPLDSRRAMLWLTWNVRLVQAYFEAGSVADGLARLSAVADDLRTVFPESVPSLREAGLVANFAAIAVTRATGVGDLELARRAADQCALLLGDVPSCTTQNRAEQLEFARRSARSGRQMMAAGLDDRALPFLEAALAQYRAAGEPPEPEGSSGPDDGVRLELAKCRNAYAWALACRGDFEDALPVAVAAADDARRPVESADDAGDEAVELLVESLDTLATVHAQLGEMRLALEFAREARALERAFSWKDSDIHRSRTERIDALIALIEQGATTGFTARR